MGWSALWKLFVLFAAVLALFAGATARPGDRSVFPPAPCAPRVTLFLTHNGYHAELALPRAWLRSQGGATAAAADRLAPSPWVLIGWGDARFYRQGGMSVARILDGLRALWPDNPSVMRFSTLSQAPDMAFTTGILRIELSEPGAGRLLGRIDRSFQTADGELLQVPALQAGDPSVYFASVERFSIVKTCNEWIGQLLNAAGLRNTPILNIAPQLLMWQTRRQTVALPECARTKRAAA